MDTRCRGQISSCHRDCGRAAALVMCAMLIGAGACARSTRDPLDHSAHAPGDERPRNVDAATALRRLLEGNARFVSGRSEHPNLGAERRSETRQGQRPFAVVLGCSDSRVPPDLVFDSGLGDLFVVRVAGNVTDDVIMGSIEYAVEHLGTNLILVMGHEKCGAVAAAVEASETHAPAPGHIDSLIEAIEPALRGVEHDSADELDNAVRANVRYVTQRLRRSRPIIGEMVKSGDVRVVGAYYDLETGQVQIIDER